MLLQFRVPTVSLTSAFALSLRGSERVRVIELGEQSIGRLVEYDSLGSAVAGSPTALLAGASGCPVNAGPRRVFIRLPGSLGIPQLLTALDPRSDARIQVGPRRRQAKHCWGGLSDAHQLRSLTPRRSAALHSKRAC